MRRFVVSPIVLQGEEILLEGDPFHHLSRVLRLTSGEEVLLLDGLGGCWRCRIEAVEKRQVRLGVLERWREEEKVFPVMLIQGLPKAEKMEILLQKGTELGVTDFFPVRTERSVPLPAGDRCDRRLPRWRRIVEEAARQCRRPRVPAVHPPTDLETSLGMVKGELRLVCWEEGAVPLRDILPVSPPAGAAVLIGPEGGFSALEIDRAERAGFVPVSLGPRILRTETAGIVMAAWLQFLFGDMG